MANVLDPATKQLLFSVNTPDYPGWIVNPDLSLVSGYPSKYWVINGETVTLMSDVDRAQLDADEAAAAETAKLAEITAAADEAITESAKAQSLFKSNTVEERLRALEFKIFGV